MSLLYQKRKYCISSVFPPIIATVFTRYMMDNELSVLADLFICFIVAGNFIRNYRTDNMEETNDTSGMCWLM